MWIYYNLFTHSLINVVLLLYFYCYKQCKDFCRLSRDTTVQEFLRSTQLGIEMLCHATCISSHFIFTRLCQIVFQGCCVVVQSLNQVSFWPYVLQLARIPSFTISPSWPKLRLLSQWCHPIISSSVNPFSPCHQSFPASGCHPHQ